MQIVPQMFDATDKGTEYNTTIVPENNAEVETKVTEVAKPVVQTPIVRKSDNDALEINDPLFKPKEPKTTSAVDTPKYTSPTKSNTNEGFYKVQPKETLFSIAKKHGLTVAQLRTLNNMGPNGTLKNGQLLKVKTNGYSTQTKVTPKPIDSTEEIVRVPEPPVNNDKVYHKVGQGETMYSISKKYKTTVSNIQKLNGASNYNVEVNQMLIVGQNQTSNLSKTNYAAQTTNISKHKIGASETLYSISKKYGVTVDQLKRWNNLQNNTISVGSYLNIKK